MAYTASRHQNADNTRNLFVEVAKQGAINLTTISYTEVDQDVRRILDSSTGIFHEDFQHRSQPFIDVVKQVRSTSTGTVTAAGLESQDGDQAQVLVAVEVKTATNGAPPPQQARNWRMRISVQKVGDGAKVSNVQFVP
ncbi:mammalian cell entry protein [Mycolicibacterium sp. CBMA 361]|nr:mammalian cell entry protein [Mycolicibacterium sp. CBMA 361]